MSEPTEKAPMFQQAPKLARPTAPLRLGLIGTGKRMTNVFCPAFASVKPWIEVVAVCGREADRRNVMAKDLGVPGFADVDSLLQSHLCDAVLIVTPPAMNHPLSLYLSRRGMPHMTETPWAVTLWQAREMLDTAQQHGVVSAVAENFFRFPRDRFAALVRDSGAIGPIHRIISYGSILGFHTSARWRKFAGESPSWVQAVSHTAPTAAHEIVPGVIVKNETYQARHLQFPGGLFVTDHCANRKGMLGRYPRDGYHEWQGESGTLISRAAEPTAATTFNDEYGEQQQNPCPTFTPEIMTLRRSVLQGDTLRSPTHDEQSEVTHETQGADWLRSYAHTSEGLLEYANPVRIQQGIDDPLPQYAVSIAGELIDFALAVRGEAEPEFDMQAAYDTVMIEVAARLSVREEGRRIHLPLDPGAVDESETDAQLLDFFGVDPHDADAVIAAVYGSAGTE